MSAEQENFEQLRRLLALKRHEQPPPGYFHDFSRQVISRIQAGETATAGSWSERLLAMAPWARRLFTGLEAKPIVAGAFGVGVCGLLVIGLVSSERIDANPSAFSPDIGAAAPRALAIVPNQSVGSLFERASRDHTVTDAVYTAQSRSSIFDEIERPRVQPVTFSAPLPGN